MTPPLFLLGAGAALASVWLAGASIGSLAGLREGRPRDLALDIALGTVLLAVAGSLVVMTGGTLSLPLVATVLAAPVAAALVTGRLRLRIAAPLPPAPLPRALLAVTAVVLLAVLTAAFRDRLTWDGWAFWTLKATMLFRDGTLPPDLFQPAGPYDYAHADYPLALPLLDWWTFRVAGEAVPALGSLVGATWFALIPVLFWDCARGQARPWLAALGALAVASFWPLTRFATGGQADVVMALAILGVTAHLAEAGETGADALWRASAFAALAAVTKNEGLALAAVAAMAVTAWLAVRRTLTPGRALAFALPLALALPWTAWVRTLGLEAEHLGGGMAPGDIPRRVATIVTELARLAVYRSWLPVAPIALAGAVLALRGPSARRLRLPLAVITLYLGAVLAVYLRAPRDLAWLLQTSLERVMGGVVPALAFLAVLGAGATSTAGERRGIVARAPASTGRGAV